MFDAIKLPPADLYDHVEEIASDELVRVLQIKNKLPRRKALISLEEKVVGILSEKGYISAAASTALAEAAPISLDDDNDDDDDKVFVDGEVDEGDIHIKPTIRKSEPTLYSEVDVKLVFKEVTSKFLRKRIVEVGGITLPVLKQALFQARDGRKRILALCPLDAMWFCDHPFESDECETREDSSYYWTRREEGQEYY